MIAFDEVDLGYDERNGLKLEVGFDIDIRTGASGAAEGRRYHDGSRIRKIKKDEHGAA